MTSTLLAFLSVAWLGLAHAAVAQPAVATTEAADTNVYLIDLPAALQLAGAQNLDVRLARERLAEARAKSDQATLRFFPWLHVGVSYRRHDGRIQDTAGEILDVNKQRYEPGGTLVGQWELGDAIYERLATKQLERASGHALEAQRQESVAAAAQEYFDLAFAQAAVGVAREAVRISTSYEAQLRSAVEAGIAFKGDLLRVSVQRERNRLALRQAEEGQRITAARLAQSLHLDPAVELRARDTDLTPIALVDPEVTLKSLVQRAISMRPELKQRHAFVKAARESRKGTVYGPLIPSIGTSVFVGGLGGGKNGDAGNFDHQEDYFVTLGWRIGPGGIFDFARQRAATARLSAARVDAEKLHDEIVRQVVEAFTRMQSKSEQIDLARRGLRVAEEGLHLAQQRQELGVGVVLENIQSEQDVTRTRRAYLKAIAELNKAQYGLSRAVGALPAAE